MRPDLRERVAAALEELRALGAADAQRYLRELHRAEPEVAAEVEEVLGPGGAAAPPDGRAPTTHGDPTISFDAQVTASFPQPAHGTAADGEHDRQLAPSQVLGRYHLLRVIGRGAFGEVWQAFDPVLQKNVAVKALLPGRVGRVPPAAFLGEARKAASLRHPAVVQVYDVGESDGVWHIVSEFVEGDSLRDRMEAGRLPFDQAARVVATVAGALHAAHLAGLVHRDVKPANILLDRAGSAYLTDFGLAISEDEQAAERSRVAGTLAYMPPEQIRGDTHLLDGRADIYSLGAVLYELLAGRPLFRAGTVEEYRELIERREPRPPRSIDGTVPDELERICLKSLSKEVRDRYRTAQDLVADLEAWLAGTTRSDTPARAGAVPDSVRRPAPKSGWRPVVVGAAALCLLAAAAVVAFKVFTNPGQTPPTTPGPAAGATPGAQPAGKVPAVKELVWPPPPTVSKWEVLTDPDRLKVYVDSTALLQLGEASADSWELSATVRQIASAGWVGLFLGHRKEPRNATASFELVQLVPIGDKVHLQRSVETYRLDNPLANPTRTISGTVSVKHLRPENTIRLTVRGNRLAEVHLNGEVIPALSQAAELPAGGPFGVYNRKSDGVFSALLFNNDPIPLLAPASPRAPEKP